MASYENWCLMDLNPLIAVKLEKLAWVHFRGCHHAPTSQHLLVGPMASLVTETTKKRNIE